jgi:Flp pilus assembly protein TadD
MQLAFVPASLTMRRRQPSLPDANETHQESLCRRALRFRRRGEERKALVAFREAALSSEKDARLWTHYGVQCGRMGRYTEAQHALSQAVWLRERAGESEKARVTRSLLVGMTPDRAA